MNKYKPLTVNETLPEELQEDINRYLEYLNNGGKNVDDCYQTEVNVSLNWCRREQLLSEETISTLKNYYVFGGIYEGVKTSMKY